MDYYEELGLTRTATVQEIRQAYKVLARLVHPDGQVNTPVRDMAERQMKRLNQILATLTDDSARREYDATLERASRQTPAAVAVSGPKWRQPAGRIVWLPLWLRPMAENWFWLSLALVTSGVAVWYLAQVHAEGRAQPAAKAAVEDKAATSIARRTSAPISKAAQHEAESSAPKHSKTPRPGRSAPLNPSRPSENLQKSSEASAKAVVSAKPFEAQMPEAIPLAAPSPAPATPPSRGDISPAVAARPPGSPFAGNWLYLPEPNENSRPGVYPAKYVELLMGEEHGLLRGTYRAEYQILDRAVSPEVTFELQGEAPPGTSAHLKWAATDGAKGDVDLALAGPNILKITWWTTEFGRHTKLASGSSTLIRQQAP